MQASPRTSRLLGPPTPNTAGSPRSTPTGTRTSLGGQWTWTVDGGPAAAALRLPGARRRHFRAAPGTGKTTAARPTPAIRPTSARGGERQPVRTLMTARQSTSGRTAGSSATSWAKLSRTVLHPPCRSLSISTVPAGERNPSRAAVSKSPLRTAGAARSGLRGEVHVRLAGRCPCRSRPRAAGGTWSRSAPARSGTHARTGHGWCRNHGAPSSGGSAVVTAGRVGALTSPGAATFPRCRPVGSGPRSALGRRSPPRRRRPRSGPTPR